ncbi:hypothetical protein [Luteitalea sp.]|uniref:hypothetical protein n=1 Tax=Luteitalea sp. TaxID=2004800 RepID=UPI0037C54DB8
MACALPVCLAAQQAPVAPADTPAASQPPAPVAPTPQGEAVAASTTPPPVGPDATPSRLRPQWAVSVYTGWLTDDNIAPVLQFRATRFDNKLFAVAVSRRQARLWKDMEWGFEGQLAKHFDGEGVLRQDHWELNGLSTSTWNRFPWDRKLDTSLTLGAGVSWASEVPPFEIYWKGQSRQLMAYLLFETTVSLPSHPHWGAMLRVHHRSSAYGLFANDMKGASNAFTFGGKYMFGSTSPKRPPVAN